MAKIEDFLSEKEEKEVIEAIQAAEKNTSGEIRVHIEKDFEGESGDRAMEVFHLLEMDQIKQENAVLIYVAVEKRSFIIYGGKGINDVVPVDFWESTKNEIQSEFKKGNFKKGLIDGILHAGEQLEKHFPWNRSDENELSDKISR